MLMFSIFFICFGILFSTICFLMKKVNKRDKILCTEKTIATVVELKKVRGIRHTGGFGGSSYTYHPVCEYEVNGETLRIMASIGSNPSDYYINQTINILYNPNTPSKYIIEGEKVTKTISTVFILFSILFIIIGIVMLIAALFFEHFLGLL